MTTIELSQDGNMICALLGPDLQAGIGGFGPTVPAALHDLAHMIERKRYPVQGFSNKAVEQSRGGLYEAKETDLANDLPIIPHEHAGIDCCGCIIVKVQGNDAELSCNECGAVVGVINTAILRDFLSLITA